MLFKFIWSRYPVVSVPLEPPAVPDPGVEDDPESGAVVPPPVVPPGVSPVVPPGVSPVVPPVVLPTPPLPLTTPITFLKLDTELGASFEGAVRSPHDAEHEPQLCEHVSGVWFVVSSAISSFFLQAATGIVQPP